MTDGPILECVINFSEGRDPKKIDSLLDAAASRAHVLDTHSDPDHNRSVLTIAGSGPQLVEAVIDIAAHALRVLDIASHTGVHPRLGTLDVVPFVPLEQATMAHARTAALEAARAIAAMKIPVFLYGHACDPPRELPEIRARAFKGLEPDLGPAEPHPLAGASVVGAREVMVAYNVNLRAPVEVARNAAGSIRKKLAHVRALGFWLDSRRLSQVSINLLLPTTTTIAEVFDEVCRLVKTGEIVEAELVGLSPLAAFAGRDAESVGLNSAPRILEEELEKVFGKRYQGG